MSVSSKGSSPENTRSACGRSISLTQPAITRVATALPEKLVSARASDMNRSTATIRPTPGTRSGRCEARPPPSVARPAPVTPAAPLEATIMKTSNDSCSLQDSGAPMALAMNNEAIVRYMAVPTGYAFNLDGTAMYLTMASLFIANAMGAPLSWSEQLSLLVFMIVASKGAAGVTGAGLATLGGGLASHRPDLVPGVGLIVAVDRFMSEARALTNFSGNAVATLVIAGWVKEINRTQADRVFSGEDPFDDTDMLDEHGAAEHKADVQAYKHKDVKETAAAR